MQRIPYKPDVVGFGFTVYLCGISMCHVPWRLGGMEGDFRELHKFLKFISEVRLLRSDQMPSAMSATMVICAGPPGGYVSASDHRNHCPMSRETRGFAVNRGKRGGGGGCSWWKCAHLAPLQCLDEVRQPQAALPAPALLLHLVDEVLHLVAAAQYGGGRDPRDSLA